MARMLWTAAFAAMAWSAFAGGNAGEDAKPRLSSTGMPERPSARPVDHSGSGVPGTVVFHGADGMVIRATVPGAATVPAYGGAATARPNAPPQARPAAAANPQAPVGGGFTPEE